MPHSVPDYNYKPKAPILYLEITDQLLVTDNGFLEKPYQGSGTQGSVENISNKLPPRDSEHCAYVSVFAYWLAIEQLLSIRDSYAQAKINLRWFRWRIPLVAQTCQLRLFFCESQEFTRWLMHEITFANQGNISKCARLFYAKRLWFPSPILGQTFRRHF